LGGVLVESRNRNGRKTFASSLETMSKRLSEILVIRYRERTASFIGKHKIERGAYLADHTSTNALQMENTKESKISQSVPDLENPRAKIFIGLSRGL
jgi:hypothetical protein